MRNNETGEFELVVGNKQLLSGFFIVVLLFAVAFAMGYVVGQNTQRPAKLASDGGREQCNQYRGGFASSTFIAGCRSGRAAGVRSCSRDATAAGLDASAHHAACPGRRSRPHGEKSAPAPADTGTVASSELPAGIVLAGDRSETGSSRGHAPDPQG